MRLTFVIAIACVTATLGIFAGRHLLPIYRSATAFPLEKAHCVFEPVVRSGSDDIPGQLVTLMPRANGATMWLMNVITAGPDASVMQHPDGMWTATTTFTRTPVSAMMTVNADKSALLSTHSPDMGWYTLVGTCLVVEMKAAT
jgi:hypothetical protein